MTKDDLTDKIKKYGETFIVICGVLGILMIPARAYIKEAVKAELIPYALQIGSFESRLFVVETKMTSVEKSNQQIIDSNRETNELLRALLKKGTKI